MFAMCWDREKCLQLIDLYKLKPELWNRNHNFYHTKTRKHDAWEDIANAMASNVETVKAKLNSLLSSFRREKSKTGKTIGTRKGRIILYKSTWFAYKRFAFLMNKNTPRKTINTEESDGAEEEVVKTEPIEQQTQEEHEEFTEIDIDTVQVSPSTTPLRSFNSPKPKIRKFQEQRVNKEDTQISHAFNILKNSPQRDSCDVYSEYIAMKLRTYNERTRSIVQHLFSNIMFDADMGKYNVSTKTFLPSTQINNSFGEHNPPPYISPAPTSSSTSRTPTPN